MTEPPEAVKQVWLSVFPCGRALPAGTTQGGKPFPQRTLHSLPQAAPTSSLLACCLVCSLNIQPEFPSSVTNFSSHHGSGEQIILVAADNIIFQDHNTGQCRCHVFWLYPYFIVKQDSNFTPNPTPF